MGVEEEEEVHVVEEAVYYCYDLRWSILACCRRRKTNSKHSGIAIIDYRLLVQRWQHTASRSPRAASILPKPGESL